MSASIIKFNGDKLAPGAEVSYTRVEADGAYGGEVLVSFGSEVEERFVKNAQDLVEKRVATRVAVAAVKPAKGA